MNWGWGTSSSHHNPISWKRKLRLEGVVAMFLPIFQGSTAHSLPRAGPGGLNTGLGRWWVSGT